MMQFACSCLAGQHETCRILQAVEAAANFFTLAFIYCCLCVQVGVLNGSNVTLQYIGFISRKCCSCCFLLPYYGIDNGFLKDWGLA